MTRLTTPARRAAGVADLALLVQSSPLHGVAFLEAYRAIRNHYGLGAHEHADRAIVEATAILAAYPRATYTNVLSLLGGKHPPTQRAHRAILAALGQAPLSRPPRGIAEDVETLRIWLLETCGPLPMTAFAGPPALQLTAPAPAQCRRIMALADPALRLAAALDLLLVNAYGYKQTIKYLLGWETLDGLRSAALARAADAPDSDRGLSWPGKAATFDLLNSWLADAPRRDALHQWRRLVSSSKRIADYLALNPDIAARINLPQVEVVLARTITVRKVVSAERSNARTRRRKTADPLADNWSDLLRLASARVAQMRQIRDAFEACCRDMTDSAGPPVRFAITLLPWLDETGGNCPVTLDFQVWPAETLRAALDRPDDPVTRTGEYVWDDRAHFLEFVGPRAPATCAEVPPILQAYRDGYFAPIGARTPQQQAAFRALVANVDLPPAVEAVALFRFTTQRDRFWSDQALRRGMTLIPVEMAHYGLAVAHAVLRSGLVAGARICETLQQAASSDCFHVTPEGDFYFEAVLKGHAQSGPGLDPRERFYCDASTLEAILEVIDVGCRNFGKPGQIAPTPRLRDRCVPDTYIYRIKDRVIADAIVNASLRVLLFGRSFASHDLRHAFAKVASKRAHRGSVQAALHHAVPSTTDHYSTPTQRDQAELARRIAAIIRPN